MRLFWLSANRFGYELLKKVQSIGIDITGIITLNEDAKTVMYDSVATNVWQEFDIPIYKVKSLNDEIDLIKKLAPDMIIMCGWRQLIDKSILNLPLKGFVGFHPTLLPKGRGPAPIINSILNDFKESGLTMFYVGEGLDDGDIIGQEKFQIESNDHAQEVYNKVIKAGKKLVERYLSLLVIDKAPRIPQNESKATVFEKLSLKNNEININESPEQIHKKIRALSKPYKGAYIKKGDKKLIIWRAELN